MASRGPSQCKVQVPIKHPCYGHAGTVVCAEVEKLKQVPKFVDAPCEEVYEGSTIPTPSNLPQSLSICKERITFHRLCEHSPKLACEKSRDTPTKCQDEVVMRSPLCGHEITVSCHMRHKFVAWHPWPTEVERELENSSTLLRDAKPNESDFPANTDVDFLRTRCKKHTTVFKFCGHTVKIPCSELFQIIQKNGCIPKGKSCLKTVTRELRGCGHEVTLTCKNWSDYVSGKHTISCKEKVEKPCWNSAKCECERLLVPCATQENEAVCCSTEMEWKCPEGKHEEKLQVCLKGEPNICPQCTTAELEEAIAITHNKAQSSVDEKTSIMQLPRLSALHNSTDPFRSLIKRTSDQCVISACLSRLSLAKNQVSSLCLPHKKAAKFFESQTSCMQKFKHYLDSTCKIKDAFQQPQYDPKLIPVLFLCVRDKRALEEQKKGFLNMNKFVKADTLHGIALYRLTAENLRGLSRKTIDSKFILLGYLYSLKSKTDCVWPSKKHRNNAVRQWRSIEGCDCVEFKGGQNNLKKLVVWNPSALYATHRLGPVSSGDLSSLSDALDAVQGKETDNPLSKCRFVEFKHGSGKPKQLKGIVQKGQSKLAPLKKLSKNFGLQTAPSLRGTWAENLEFCFNADESKEASVADVLQLNAFTVRNAKAVEKSAVVSESAERDLYWKLSFVNCDVPPFAGKKQLQTLLSNGVSEEKTVEENGSPKLLRVLASLEFFAKSDVSRAKEELQKYCSALRKSSNNIGHPLLLLAFARLGLPGFNGASTSYQFLADFHAIAPSMAAILLTTAEKSSIADLNDLVSDEDEGAIDRSTAQHSNSPASPTEQWNDLQESYNCQSSAMDKLLKLTELLRVKLAALRLFKQGMKFSQMDVESREKNAPSLNYIFLGNPGTGKTTVARLFAEILHDSGHRQKQTFIESSGQKLKEDSPDEFRKKAISAMDGVFFIDEAYTLDPIGDKIKGAPIANELLTLAENNRSRLSFILAGYQDELNEKLFEFNPGFKSRFTEVHFDDFDEPELLEVWNCQRQDRGWTEAHPNLGLVVVRRLAKMRGRKGFGNARDIRSTLEAVCSRAIGSDEFDPGNMVLEMTHAVGESPLTNPKLDAVLHKINSMTGWTSVKKSINELVEVCGRNYEREIEGMEPLPVFLNRMFLGNPGTGKTTCAKFYGEVLKHLGFLSNGELVAKQASDFGGSVIGQSQQKTAKLLESSRGKVLMIDEAYSLDDSQYGKQALNTIVEKVQGTEADDIAVILIGYEEEMMRMLDNQNPGLRRRFDPKQAFIFEDYTEHQLDNILSLECEQKHYRPSIEFRDKMLKKLNMQKRSETHFGNAGSVKMP